VTPADRRRGHRIRRLPTPLIVDGHVDETNLRQLGLDVNWLLGQLAQRGIRSPRDVLYASLDTKGNLFFQAKADRQGVSLA